MKGITRKKDAGQLSDVFFCGWIFENEGFCGFLPVFMVEIPRRSLHML